MPGLVGETGNLEGSCFHRQIVIEVGLKLILIAGKIVKKERKPLEIVPEQYRDLNLFFKHLKHGYFNP